MQKLIVLFFCLLAIMFFPDRSVAQEKAKVEIVSARQKGNTVLFTVASSGNFIVGGNVYVLHIGDKTFSHYKQSVAHGKGSLAFLIPAADFNNLKEGANIYLTYGNKNETEKGMEEMSKPGQGPCWALGKFNPQILTK
jgi:hypothetical protein